MEEGRARFCSSCPNTSPGGSRTDSDVAHTRSRFGRHRAWAGSCAENDPQSKSGPIMLGAAASRRAGTQASAALSAAPRFLFTRKWARGGPRRQQALHGNGRAERARLRSEAVDRADLISPSVTTDREAALSSGPKGRSDSRQLHARQCGAVYFESRSLDVRRA